MFQLNVITATQTKTYKLYRLMEGILRIHGDYRTYKPNKGIVILLEK